MTNKHILKLSKVAVALAALTLGYQASAITFDFTGPFNTGSNGNTRSFTADGITLEASAWSSDDSESDFQTGSLGQFNIGLGVGNGIEAIDNHTIDNDDRIDYVLFTFDQLVWADTTDLAVYPWQGDSDITVYIGNFADPSTIDFTTTTSLSDFTYLENDNGNGSRIADINDGGVMGNAILIAAQNNSNNNETFKIRALKVPENGTTLALLGLALIGLFSSHRRWKM